jgi:calcium-dependent protein kinase
MHRDLKPESIVIKKLENNTYKIKFVNFSTATEFIEGKQLTQFVGTHYYVAPEVITKNYNELCDIWSCGIIMYILICEYPPFQGKNNDEILHNIRFTELKFKKNEWAHISNSCKDLIRKMLSKNPKKRPSADICLKHRWFKGLTQIVNDLSTINQIKAVHKMAGFIKGNKFKQAVLQFMVNHFDLKHEEKKLNVIFNKFDVNNTGKVTKKNFLNELIKIYGEKDANNLTNKIFGSIDLDGNGDISYNEFLTAIMDSKKLMTDDKLEKTFKLIDKNGDGKITISEIKNIFGGDVKQWKKIIRELDKDIKDELNLDDFKRVMTTSENNMDEGSFESENFDEDKIYENEDENEYDDDNVDNKS